MQGRGITSFVATRSTSPGEPKTPFPLLFCILSSFSLPSVSRILLFLGANPLALQRKPTGVRCRGRKTEQRHQGPRPLDEKGQGRLLEIHPDRKV